MSKNRMPRQTVLLNSSYLKCSSQHVQVRTQKCRIKRLDQHNKNSVLLSFLSSVLFPLFISHLNSICMPKKKAGKKGKAAGKKAPAGLPEGYDSVAAFLKKEVKLKLEAACAANQCAVPASMSKFLDGCIAEEKIFDTVVCPEREFTGPLIRSIVQTLAQWVALRSFCVWRGSCGDEGATSLGDLLRQNPSLKSLEILDSGVSVRGARAIGDALCHPGGNCTLRYLLLDHNPLGDAGARALSEAMSGNPDLRILSLRYNLIGPDGADALSRHVIGGMRLTELRLRGNRIGDVGAAAIAAALLRGSVTVHVLDLMDNGITAEGATALSRATAAAPALEVLELDANPIGEAGARAVLDALNARKVARGMTVAPAPETGDAAAPETPVAPVAAPPPPPESTRGLDIGVDVAPSADGTEPPSGAAPLWVSVTEKLPRDLFLAIKTAVADMAPAKKGKKKGGKKKSKT
jgi:Ran GTPase-activating protein (RanGAP) involved in mRNA processing and transport